jgi:translation initiation factor 2B subunit (eIF-2B alpha/beta/delta family)
MDINAALSEIAADHLSGARALARKGLGVLRFACGRDAASREAWFDALWDVGRRLIRSQPSMAPFLNMVNEALLAADTGETLAASRKAALLRLEELSRTWEETASAAARHAATLIPEGARVLTHSFSSVVEQCILLCHREGRISEVTCTESRPMREGVALARELAAAGMKVTFVADALAPAELSLRADVALVGADAVRADGLVNKAGTFCVALAAGLFHKPMYALCGSEKLVPGACSHLLSIDEPRVPEELLPEPIAGVTARNVQFDITPLDHLSAVVTEDGALSPEQVLSRVEALPVHPRLVAASAAELRGSGPGEDRE